MIGFTDSIRNYMSKPWFLKMALEGEPSPLARRIADVLKTSARDVQTNVDGLAEGIAALTTAPSPNRPHAVDEVA